MKQPDSHLSDQQLLLDVEGELSGHEANMVRAHLSACWNCRARRQEFERAIADFVRVHRQEFEPELPPAAGPRALLKARLAELAASGRESPAPFSFTRGLKATAAICMALALGIAVTRLVLVRERRVGEHAGTYYMPDARLTPGATVLLSRTVVCAQPGDGNKAVPVALQRQVFREYGIPRADPRAYEVDYLVTPALGGADDIHNLWPHSHSATWNAHVKDALEDRLRAMVCDGSLDLTEAQQEIATDWISAYKKYFHTREPLPEHRMGPGRDR
jgi:anti-sigma factor RsiW